MDEEHVYICGKCDRLFSSTRGRYSNEACPGCGRTATYLCTKSRWLGLGKGERASLVAEREPKSNAALAAKNEPEPAAMQQGGDGQARRPYGTHAAPASAHDDDDNKTALVLGIIGAALFAFAGLQMLGITSVASYKGDGGSISESFYHAMGWFSFGMALVSATLGYLGWKR